AAASAASLRLRVIVSSGSVLAKRSLGFVPAASAGAARPPANTQTIIVAIDRFMFFNLPAA
ncbi:MAG: hypothetical protein WAM62_04975, partial [Pseudolabrys sp.]